MRSCSNKKQKKERYRKGSLLFAAALLVLSLGLTACGLEETLTEEQQVEKEEIASESAEEWEALLEEGSELIEELEADPEGAEEIDETLQVGGEDGVTAEEESAGPADPEDADEDAQDAAYVDYYFRSEKLLNQHYEKHGIEMGFASAEEYEKAASDVINNPAALTKTEAEDGDYVYYVEETNEFVILSTDGYIRTYFLPSAGKSYYDRQ